MSSATTRASIKTLRARLTLWYLAILVISLAIFAGLLYGVLSRSLHRHHDEELALEVRRLAEVLQRTPTSRTGVAAALSTLSAVPQYVALWNSNGDPIYRSTSLDSAPTVGRAQALAHAGGVLAAPHFFTARVGQVGPVRFVCVPLDEPFRGQVVQVGLELGDVNDTLDAIATASLTVFPVVLVLTSFGGLLIARRALAPLESIASTVQEIQATDLSRRIDVHPRDEELGRLVSTLNQLLDRLEGAFASLREFAADTSHQLQTPLTLMKGSLELALTSERHPEPTATLLSELLDDANHMTALVKELHSLSVAGDRPVRTNATPVALSDVVRDAMEIIGALGELNDVSVESRIVPDLMVWGDEVRLKQVLLNLGENAVKYTAAGGRVEIDLSRGPGQAVLRISDTGPGIAERDLPRVFDRFYRAVPAGGMTTGSGLGLTIVKRIVVAHGGTIEVTSRVGEGAQFSVRLPLA